VARVFEIEKEERRPNLHVVHHEKEALAIFGIPKANFAPLRIR
jgi:hypothetical protein